MARRYFLFRKTREDPHSPASFIRTTMLVPKKNRIAVYSYLFKGACVRV